VPRCSRFLTLAALGLAAGVGSLPVEAQLLELKRSLPGPGDLPCVGASARPGTAPPADPAMGPSEEDRAAAGVLVSESSGAAILGDHARAASLLREAARLDPTSAVVAFRLGRTLEELGADAEAFSHFCRSLELAPDGPDSAEARARVQRLAEGAAGALPVSVQRTFAEGVDAYDGGRYGEASRSFSRVLVEAPDLEEGIFNLGLTYHRLGRTAAAQEEFERYLEVRPDAEDAGEVRSFLATTDPPPPTLRPEYSPGTAFIAGLLVPGLGHFYSARPRTGILLLGGAAAGASIGLLYRKVEVDCLVEPAGDECPPGLVADRREERPFLVPGLAAAAALALGGAIHALVTAGRADSSLDTVSPRLEVRVPGTSDPLLLEPIWGDGGVGLTGTLRVGGRAR